MKYLKTIVAVVAIFAFSGLSAHAATILVTNSSDTLNTFRTNTNTNFAALNTEVTTGKVATSSAETAGYFPVWSSTGGTPATLAGTSNLFQSGSNVGIGTTTPGTLLSLGNTGTNTINLNTTATSTFGSGIDLRSGCFSINGSCVGGGSASLTGSTGQVAYFSASNTAAGTSTINISTASLVGIGTTTPVNLLDVYSSGTPVIGISKGAGLNNTISNTGANFAFNQEFASGNFLFSQGGLARMLLNATGLGIGTTSPSQLLSVHGNGLFSGNISTANLTATGTVTTTNLSATNATTTGKQNIPNNTNPTVVTSGDIAINTLSASTSLRYFDGTAERTVNNILSKSFTVASSTLAYNGSFGASGTTTIPLWNNRVPMSVVEVTCVTNVGTAHVDLHDGTNHTNDVTCSTTGPRTTVSTNNTWIIDENFRADIGRSASSPALITITVFYRETAD
jgi:hypothetical protein